jgi:mono/diheme cytochrome c family protein
LRRYLLTIILLMALLVVGGLATASLFGVPSLTRGGYVPTLSNDPQAAATQAFIFVASLGAIIVLTIGLGIFLAVIFYRFTLMMAANSAAVQATERTGTSKPSSTDQGLGIPLSSNRSVAIFWVVLIVLVIGSQVLRYWGEPIGYLPGISTVLGLPVFQLPGDHIQGLPPFIAGPGDTATAGQLLILVLGVSVVGVLAIGVGMARGFAQLDQTVKTADKLPPTLPDRLIPMIEHQIQSLRSPRPRRLPGNPIDGFLIGLNILLLLVIVGIVAFYVVPSYSGVAAVDNAIAATQIAALITPTPPGGGTGPSPADVMSKTVAALPAGNPDKGQALTASAGCVACHIASKLGPPWRASDDSTGQGVGTRAQHRFTDPGYTGVAKSAHAYMYESIVQPNAYVVPNYQANIMPQTFGKTLSQQDLADIIAYLDTLK